MEKNCSPSIEHIKSPSNFASPVLFTCNIQSRTTPGSGSLSLSRFNSIEGKGGGPTVNVPLNISSLESESSGPTNVAFTKCIPSDN